MSQNYWMNDFGFDIHSSLTPSFKDPVVHKFYLRLEVQLLLEWFSSPLTTKQFG